MDLEDITGNLENIAGNFKAAFSKTVPSTALHVDELAEARITDKDLRNYSFYTPDGQVYFLKGKNEIPMWAVTRELTNPILKHIGDAFNQLTKEENYKVEEADFDAAIAAQDTKTFDLTKITLIKHNHEFSYISVITSKKLGEYNRETQKAIKRIFGPTAKDYYANMTEFSKFGIEEVKIVVLTPNYVMEHAKNGPIARASWLVSFGNGSGFGAGGRGVGSGSRVRGVRRSAEGASVEKISQETSFKSAYNKIVTSPQELTEETASGLLQAVANFYLGQQKK